MSSLRPKYSLLRTDKGGRPQSRSTMPHSMHADFDYFYYFLIVAPMLVAVMIYSGIKLMTYLENRRHSLGQQDNDESASNLNKRT